MPYQPETAGVNELVEFISHTDFKAGTSIGSQMGECIERKHVLQCNVMWEIEHVGVSTTDFYFMVNKKPLLAGNFFHFLDIRQLKLGVMVLFTGMVE